MARLTLEEILALDEHDGLLDVKPASLAISSDDVRVRQDFSEINSFVSEFGFVPGKGPVGSKPSIRERMLAMRLNTFVASEEVRKRLADMDHHALLVGTTESATDPQSLDEIFDLNDELLEEPSVDIFSMKHARPKAARPDKVSERKEAKDFDIFKPLFDSCVADLVSGKRKSIKFANEQEVRAGEFFILNGVMVYVAEVNDPHVRNGKRNARLRLIFENGTEGENLLRSLATELYKDPSGRRISSPIVGPLFHSEPTTEMVKPEARRSTGCIYVVKSLSLDSNIRALDGMLFKIGFTTGSFEARIRSAKDDPTFLFAPVHPVRTYEAYDLNVGKFEKLLHRFFADARWEIELPDRFGGSFRPKEWFSVPIEIIERAVPMILDGSIVKYTYDRRSQSIRLL